MTALSDDKTNKLVDLAVVGSIAVLGLGAAWLTFGILDSSANTRTQDYSVTGAMAGAIASWTILFGFYFQARRSSRDVERVTRDYQRQTNEMTRTIFELQNKVMRSAPIPESFVPEISERQQVVVARPKNWEQTGGVIFQFQAPDADDPERFDAYPPQFTLYYYAVSQLDAGGADGYYERYRKGIPDAEWVVHHTAELIDMGGTERGGIPSLKIIAIERASITLERDPLSGRVTRSIEPVTDWFFHLLQRAIEVMSSLEVDQPNSAREQGRLAGGVEAVDRGLVTPRIAQALQDDEDIQQLLAIAEVSPDEAPDLLRRIIEDYHESTEVSYAEFVGGERGKITLPMTMTRMKVLTYHEALEMVFEFDFLDDSDHFEHESHHFNELLSSVRFLA